MTKKLENSCMNDFDPNALDEIQAIKRIVKSIKSSTKKEKLIIRNSIGRIVADDIKSNLDIPNFRNSAMDGYAINIKLLKSNKYILKEQGVSLAGKPYSKKLVKNETVKVMTGALIPDNADAVIILTEWEEYRKLDWKLIAKNMVPPSWVFDSRSIVNTDEVKDAGLRLWRLGNGLAD